MGNTNPERQRYNPSLRAKSILVNQDQKEVSYDGETLNRVKHGNGKCIFTDDSEYAGEWRNGYRHGWGTFTTPDSIYEGEFQNNLRHGYGTQTYPNNEENQMDEVYFEGYWQNDHKQMGRSKYENEITYTGEFLNNMKDGQGKLESEEKGFFYDGQWSKDEINGYGEFCEQEGIHYIGNWYIFNVRVKNKKCGHGELRFKNFDTYKGEFLNDLMHGKGVFTTKGGETYSGVWKEGELAHILDQACQTEENFTNAEKGHQESQTEEIMVAQSEIVVKETQDADIQVNIIEVKEMMDKQHQSAPVYHTLKDQEIQTEAIENEGNQQETSQIQQMQQINQYNQINIIQASLEQKYVQTEDVLFESKKQLADMFIQTTSPIYVSKKQQTEYENSQKNIQTDVILSQKTGTQTNFKKQISNDFKILTSKLYLQKLYDKQKIDVVLQNLKTEKKNVSLSQIQNQKLQKQLYELEQNNKSLEKELNFYSIQQSEQKGTFFQSDLDQERRVTINLLKSKNKLMSTTWDKMDCDLKRVIDDFEEHKLKYQELQEQNKKLDQKNNHLKGQYEVLELTHSNEIKKHSHHQKTIEKLNEELQYKEDTIKYQEQEFGRIVEFYRKEYSTSKQIDLESNLVYTTQKSKIDLHIQIKKLQNDLKKITEEKEFEHNFFLAYKTKQAQLVTELKQSVLKKNLEKNSPNIDYQGELYQMNKRLESKILQLEKLNKRQEFQIRDLQMKIGIFEAKDQDLTKFKVEDTIFKEWMQEVRYSYMSFGKFDFMYFKGEPNEKTIYVKEILVSGSVSGIHSQIYISVHDTLENKLTQDLLVRANDDLVQRSFSFLVEEGDLLVRSQLANCLVKIYVRGDREQSKIKLDNIQIIYKYQDG